MRSSYKVSFTIYRMGDFVNDVAETWILVIGIAMMMMRTRRNVDVDGNYAAKR